MTAARFTPPAASSPSAPRTPPCLSRPVWCFPRSTIVKRILVRYKVKVDRAEENERYIHAVYEQLARERPAGLRYATFKLDDGVSFVHIASHESDGGSSPLTAISAFKAFLAGIADRCEEQPVTAELHEVDEYAFFK